MFLLNWCNHFFFFFFFFCGKFHKGSHFWLCIIRQSRLLIGIPLTFFIPLLIMEGNIHVLLLFFSLYLMLYLLCSVQKCVLSPLVIRGEVRWENNHHHWSQHWHWQRNSQGSGKKRYCLGLSGQLCLSLLASIVYLWLSHADVPALPFIFTNFQTLHIPPFSPQLSTSNVWVAFKL